MHQLALQMLPFLLGPRGLPSFRASCSTRPAGRGRTADGTPVQTFDCNGTASQEWERTKHPPTTDWSPVIVQPMFSL